MFEVSYGLVEAALVAAYAIGPADVLRFRSRLGALQRGGLLSERPGKGRRLTYRPDQFHRLVFALELSELSVAPATILQMVEDFWEPKLRAIFSAAESAITRPSEGEDIHLVVVGMTALTPARAFLTYATARDLPVCMSAAMRDAPHPARAVVVNLSARLRRFHTALADSHPLHWGPPAEKPKRKKKRAARAKER